MAADEPVPVGRTLEQWRQTLKAVDPSLRWQAAEALGQLGQREPRLVVRALSQAVGDEDLDVRLQAVAALTLIRQYAEPAVPALGAALQDKDSDPRRQAALALALGAIGPRAESATGALSESSRAVLGPARHEAAIALGRIGGKAVAELARNLEHLDVSVRAWAAEGLQVLGYRARPAFGALCKALADEDATVRARAASSLRASDPEPNHILPILKQSLHAGNDLTNRLWSINWVGEIATGIDKQQAMEAVVLLTASLSDPEAPVRLQAAFSLGNVGAEAGAGIKGLQERIGDRAGGAVVAGSMKKPPASVFAQPLADALLDRTLAVRLQAAVAFRSLELGEGQDEQVIPRLEKLVDDRDTVVRLQSVITLGVLGPSSKLVKLDHLQELLKDRDSGIRANAVEALGRFGARASKAVTNLQRALKDQDGIVRRLAAASLGQIGASGLSALAAALDDKDYDVRRSAVVVMGNMGIAAREALPALRKALDDKDEEVVAAAAVSVKKVEVR